MSSHYLYFPITNHFWHSLFSSCILCAVGMICETNVGRIVVDLLTLLVITFYTLSCHSQFSMFRYTKWQDREWCGMMVSLAPQHLQVKAAWCFPIYRFAGVLEENRLDLQKSRKWNIKGYSKKTKRCLFCNNALSRRQRATSQLQYQRSICLHK